MTMAQQGIGTKSPKLSDIPLPGEETGDAKPAADEKAISKTNSLKRFFKMSGKRGEESLSGTSEEPQAPGVGAEGVESGLAAEQAKQKPMRRFHLRLGGIHKHADEEAAPQDLAATASCTATGTSGSGGTSSKSGLKGSISNYWNYVFKRSVKPGKPAASDEPNGNDAEDEDEDAEEEAAETQIREEVHTLAISEEAPDEIAKP